MTQRDEALRAVEKINGIIAGVAAPLLAAWRELDGVVGRAQNGPPDGEADGSIDEATFIMLRDFSRSVARSLDSLESTIAKEARKS